MAVARYQHSIVLSQELEEAWLQRQESIPDLSFNAFVCDLIKEALCVTGAPTSTIRSEM
jgi:hypothetical protein